MKLDLSIHSLHALYRGGSHTPATIVDYILDRCRSYEDHNIWISLLSRKQIQPWLDKLRDKSPDELPLYGVPFAIKDNIDLASVATTAACPQFSYIPEHSAHVVDQLIRAGAVPIGKTNMDQFATGLVGTRSPYGAVRNSLNPDYISGGSSSGSAVATALGLVTFALGTDTAGSGRIPAMFNNLLGLKPSCGVVSTRGVVPACRSLDCVSLFALNPDDMTRIYPVMTSYDEQDSYARRASWPSRMATKSFRFGTVPLLQRQEPGNTIINQLLQQITDRLVALGGTPVEIDFSPFQQAAKLLYEGPWVAERYAAIEQLITKSPEVLFPVTRTILAGATRFSAADTFKAIYRLRDLKLQADRVLASVDFILTPTASNIYTLKAVDNDPINLNSQLGYYTNFMNLLDYAALAIPAGTLDNSMPFGVTLFADRFNDHRLISLSQLILGHSGLSMGATGFNWQPDTAVSVNGTDTNRVNLLVCGAHLSGMPLNRQLIDLDAELVQATTTAPAYRMYALAGGPPHRPGLVKTPGNGACIAVEIWSIPLSNLGRFMAGIPAPLGLGRVELSDGTEVIGFICEPYAIDQAVDITSHGGWVNYMNSLRG